MTRTVMTSIAKTCPACRATNTVVAATTEIRPLWQMNCSRCGTPLGQEGRPRPDDRPDGRRVPVASAVGVPSTVRAAERHEAGAAARHRRRRLSRCCSSLHVAAGAALGVACTTLLIGLTGPADHPGAGADDHVLAAASAPAPSVRRETPFVSPVAAEPPAGRSAGEWDVAMEAALEAELAQLEALAPYAGARNPHSDALGFAGAPVDPETATRAEAALDLSRRDRRELQRRLRLAEHDPRLVDGIFGPATRAAIADWQGAVGLQPTGYFDEHALALLEQRTDDLFRAWQTAEAKRDRGRRTRTAGLAGSTPAAAAAGARCQRTWSGEIAYGQTMLCDFRGLRENVAQLFRASERS